MPPQRPMWGAGIVRPTVVTALAAMLCLGGCAQSAPTAQSTQAVRVELPAIQEWTRAAGVREMQGSIRIMPTCDPNRVPSCWVDHGDSTGPQLVPVEPVGGVDGNHRS
jgi:hypothetical protein